MAYGNDIFAAATVLTGSSGSITPFHYDGIGDPAGSEGGESVYGNGETLWWRWVAPFSGAASFTTSGSPSDDLAPEGLDTTLQVFTGGGFASPVVSNDDGTGVAYDYNSRADFTATSGVTYWIQLDQLSAAQAGTVHLSWALTAPPAPVAHVDAVYLLSPGLGLTVGTLLPSTASQTTTGYATGDLTGLVSLRFPGGAVATLTSNTGSSAQFVIPMAGTIHSGRARFSGPGGSAHYDLTILAPETPTFARTFAPGSAVGDLLVASYAGTGPRPGVIDVKAVARDGTDLADALTHDATVTDGRRIAQYAAASGIEDEFGFTYPASKSYGMALLTVGWVDSSSFYYGLKFSPSSPAPGPVLDQSAIEYGGTWSAVPDIWTGSVTMPLPLMAVAGASPWGDITAEVYLLQPDELTDSGSDYPTLGAGMPNDLWRSPSWFSGRTPLLTHDFGALAPDTAVEALGLSVEIPTSAVWHGSSADARYAVLVMITSQYRESADDPPTGIGRSGGGVVFNPEPYDTSPSSSFSSYSSNISPAVAVQEPPYRYWTPDGLTGSADAPPLRQLQRGDALAGGAPRQLQTPAASVRQGPGRIR